MNRFLILLTMLFMPLSAIGQSTAVLDGIGLANGRSYTNYIKNPNAQKNTINVTATGDTGIARSVTTPLYASTEFNITDTNAWGATWSALAFNEGLKGRLCEVQILARSTAADVATLKVFQNSVAVFTQSLTLSTTNPTKYGGTFPCGDLTYASTVELAGAADPGTIEVGNVYLGEPVSVSSGGVMTEWQSYTPTVTGLGTGPTLQVKYRRIGDSLSIRGTVVVGTSPSGTIDLTLPSGLSANTAKLGLGLSSGTGYIPVGESTAMYYDDTATATLTGTVNLAAASTTNIRFTDADGTVSAPWGGTVPVTVEVNDRIHFQALIPISGWAATDIVTPEASISGQARYTRSTTQSIAGASFEVVDFATKSHDINNEVTTGSSWKFTAKSAGYYQVSSKVIFESSSNWGAGEYGQMAIYKTPSGGAAAAYSYGEQKAVDATVTQLVPVSMSDVVYLAVGDAVDVRVGQLSGAALNIVADGRENFVSIAKITGPGSQSFYLQGPVKGGNSGNAISAGDVGEEISSNPAGAVAVAASSSVINKTITSITVTPGTWDVRGSACLSPGTINSPLRMYGAISLTDNAIDDTSKGNLVVTQYTDVSTPPCFPVGSRIVRVTTNTVLYLTAGIAYSSAGTAAWNVNSNIKAIRLD